MLTAPFPAALRRLLLTVLAAACAVLVGVGPAVRPAHADAPEATVTEITLPVAGTPEPDGEPVTLDTSLWTTDPGVPKPAIVLAHGFGGSKNDAGPIAQELARDGYTVITYSARGFGSSGGLIHLGSATYEGRDTVRIIDAAADRPEVSAVGADPVIGFAGASYGGAAALLAAGLDDRVDAIVPAFTWHSLTQALVPQYAVEDAPATTSGTQSSLAAVDPVDEVGVFKQRWAGLFFLSGLSGGAPAPSGDGRSALCGRFAADICQEYLQTALTGDPSPGMINLLDRSSTDSVLPRITAPTLIVQGAADTLFTLDQADANLRGLPASTPAAMSWVQGGHDGGIDLSDLLPPLRSWFDRYLRNDETDPVPPMFSSVVPSTALVGRDGQDDGAEPTTVTADRYPGRGGGTVPLTSTPLAGGTQEVVAPPGGVPTAMTSLPGGSSGAAGAAAAAAAYPLAVLPGQSAVFTTDVLDAPVRLLGSGRVRLEVTSSVTTATVFVGLWDLGPDMTPATPTPGATPGGAGAGPEGAVPQTAVLPQSVVAPVRVEGLTPGRATTVDVALPAVAHQVPIGHRLRVVVSSTDQAYANRKAGAVYQIGLSGEPHLMLPQLPTAQVVPQILDVPLPLVLVVSGLLVAAIVGAFVLRRRERASIIRPELAEVPLVVEGLKKTYADGLRAVDGVSFDARPGQVLGLLGPNGAGKTTVMRMLVGLIRPDAGTVFVHGESVSEGAEVLRDVGAFIEGPGFLPHLTGRQNLDAYWEVTGRPREEAHLDEALAVAGLGEAIDRRVRGYSQGMRQRLGIAQAMLGRPSLLLLDEPTNGLDPPQINAMRAVLRDYAATGRTVVVSSHLLGEVEQTCSHVVMMSGGRVVLSGSVEELTLGRTRSLEQVFLDLLTGADR